MVRNSQKYAEAYVVITGHGKLSFGDGSYYEGEFKDGEIEGKGYRYFSASGNSYEGIPSYYLWIMTTYALGDFHEGEFQGQGTMVYANGSRYTGDWVRNKRQGFGVYDTDDNSVYKVYKYLCIRRSIAISGLLTRKQKTWRRNLCLREW